MNNNHKALAAKLSKLEVMARPKPRIIDCTGAREQLSRKLAQMRDNTPPEEQEDDMSEEEAAAFMANLTEVLERSASEIEKKWNVKFVSRSLDD